jgi:hypothetical protein
VASVSPDTLLLSKFVGMGAVAVNFSMTCRPLPAGWSLMHNNTGEYTEEASHALSWV